MSFGERLLIALAFLATVSAVELVLRGRRATRWRSSLSLIACAVLGAAVGAAVDLLTSTLGPAYFAVGKGLGEEPGLTGRAVLLGLQAGTGAGVVVGAVLLLVARRPLRLGEVARTSARIAAHVVVGLVLGAAVGSAVPVGVVGDAGFAVEDGLRRGFLVAWGAHLGVYLGALVGLVRAARRQWVVRRAGITGPERV